MADGKLAGKVAYVTGGDCGLGSAMCKTLAAHGAAVCIGWRGKDPAKADAVVAEIKAAGGKAMAVEGNVADAADIQADIDSVVKEFGGIHICVNNAGYENDHAFLEMPVDTWRGVIDVNLTGPFIVGQTCAKHMAAQGLGGVFFFFLCVFVVFLWFFLVF